jgi:hypothetical protein
MEEDNSIHNSHTLQWWWRPQISRKTGLLPNISGAATMLERDMSLMTIIGENMNKNIKICICALLITTFQAIASSPADSIFLGIYDGTGRTCYGLAKLTPKYFSWKSPFQSVKDSPYEVIEQRQDKKQKKLTIRLTNKLHRWNFPIICFEQDIDNPEQAWAIYGFVTLEDYKKQNIGDAFGCSMVKQQ